MPASAEPLYQGVHGGDKSRIAGVNAARLSRQRRFRCQEPLLQWT